MPNSWKHRLGIAVSAIWVLLLIVGYLMDPYKDFRASAFGITLFGIVPISMGWLAWWVWDAFAKSK